MKTVMITLTEDIPETELGKSATIAIEGRSYTGKVVVIIAHEAAPAVPASTTVTLEAPGLKTK